MLGPPWFRRLLVYLQEPSPRKEGSCRNSADDGVGYRTDVGILSGLDPLGRFDVGLRSGCL